MEDSPECSTCGVSRGALGAQKWSSFLGNQDNFVVEGTSLKDKFAFLRWERAGEYLE